MMYMAECSYSKNAVGIPAAESLHVFCVTCRIILHLCNDITSGVTCPLRNNPSFLLDVDRGYKDPTGVDRRIYFNVNLRFQFGRKSTMVSA